MTFLFNPLALTIVFGGTLLATLLRCGWADSRRALRVLAHLPGRAFDADRVRAELAAQIQEIDRRGLLASEPHRFGDGEFDELSDTLVRRRSVTALYQEHDRHRSARVALSSAAVRVLSTAAELAPVLGLAGTLISLGGMRDVGADANYAGAIANAVGTTIYGLILSTFVCSPLAAAVERRAKAEEAARQALLDWLAAKIRLAGADPAPAAKAEAGRAEAGRAAA